MGARRQRAETVRYCSDVLVASTGAMRVSTDRMSLRKMQMWVRELDKSPRRLCY